MRAETGAARGILACSPSAQHSALRLRFATHASPSLMHVLDRSPARSRRLAGISNNHQQSTAIRYMLTCWAQLACLWLQESYSLSASD